MHRLGVNNFFCEGTWNCDCNISAFKGSYSLELGVVDSLWADVIQGLDLKMHCSATFVTGCFRRSDRKVCSVAAANVQFPLPPGDSMLKTPDS